MARRTLVFSLQAALNDPKLKGPGTVVVNQFFVFIDKRTGYTDEQNPLPVKESGFKLTIEEYKYGRKVKKEGSASNGVSAGRIAAADVGPWDDEYK